MTHLFSIAVQNAAIATLLALLVWGVTRILKNPPVAHILWLLVLVKLVTPPVVHLELGGWRSEPVKAGNEQAADRSSPMHRPIVAGSQLPIDRSPKIARGDAELGRVVGGSPNSTVGDNPHDVLDSQPRITIAAAWNTIRPVVIWFWLGGVGLVALLAGVRIVRFQRMLPGTLPASQRLQSVADELASRLGLRRSPDVRVVESAVAPLVWCVGRRATIVLPLRLLCALDEHQTAMVLVHELAHLRRRDHWVRLVELVVSVLYWWNPLVWWVRQRLHAVEEQCCDAWVAWVFPDRSHDYAASLLKAAELVPHHSSLLVLASPFLHTHTLKARIEMVLKNRSRRTASRGAAVCLALVAAVVIPAGIRGAAGSDRQTESTSPEAQTKAVAVPVARPKEQDTVAPAGAAQTEAALSQNAVNEKPIITKEYQPFQGSWSFDVCDSQLWRTELEVIRKTWTWKIQGQEITWARQGKDPVKLAFTVDPSKSPNQIDFTFLDGPDKGEKCLGIYEFERGNLVVCMTEPGAKGDRPTRMAFTNSKRNALIILVDRKPAAGAARVGAAPAPIAGPETPIAKEFQPFQGGWNMESYGSLKWPAQREEFQTWQWTIQGQEITWKRPRQETAKLAFTVDPGFTRDDKKWPNNLELTFLDGPDRGQKCLGIFYWLQGTDTLWICFQDPGAKADRPKTMGFNGFDRDTVIALRPTVPATGSKNDRRKQPTADPALVPLADTKNLIASELQVFQGTWNFGACDSVLWYTDLDVVRKTWKWTIKGQEITWARVGKEAVRLSFTVDPTKTPNQIDFTFLDGPDQGKKCQGIYEFERDSLWICMTEPGAKVDRPTQMEMSGSSKTALIILQDKDKKRTVGAEKPVAPKAEATPLPIVGAEKPIAKGLELLKGTFKLETWRSDKWAAKPDEFHAWRWTIQGQEIIWTRPNQKDVRLFYTVDSTASPRRIDLTFLDGPDQGEKCQGIYFASRHEINICFQDPGAKVGRPTNSGSEPGSRHTSITLVPAEVLPVAEEVQALQGLWHFDIYYSNWWPGRISNPPVGWADWRWTVKGNEIRWTGMKVPDVKLSFMVDPSKSPRQIDMTFLDGPHKGKTLRGIYQFYSEHGCYICFADPDAKVDRPADVSYSTFKSQTMVAIER